MKAIATICNDSSCKFLGTNLLKQRRLKNTLFAHSFSASRSVFWGGGFVPDKLWVANAMDGFIRTSAFRDEKRDEHLHVLEREAFIDGSSEFLLKFLSQEVESTLNRLSKWIVTALFGVFFLWRRDADALWFAAGSILNVVLSITLKQIVNQKRPSTLKSDPGMPSSHAQSIFFTVMFIILSSVDCLGINEFTITSSCWALAFGSYFSYLRVSQKLHTVSQVVVGAVIGFVCSILWYWLWNAFMQDAFASSLWVGIIIVLGSAGIWLGYFSHVILHWLKEE